VAAATGLHARNDSLAAVQALQSVTATEVNLP